MKRVILFMLVVAVCVSCASKKKVAEYGYSRVKIEVPCVKEGFDDNDYFRATGTAASANQQNARIAALENAKAMIQRKLGGFVAGLTTDYNRNTRGNAIASDVEGIIESEFEILVEKYLNDARQTCEEMTINNAGLFESYISIEIPKKQLINDFSKQLDENDKLSIEFNRDEFRKYAEEKVANMKANLD